MRDTALDAHEWRSEWEALAPELADAPAKALPELARLVERMLRARGYESGADTEIDRELDFAREVVERLEDSDVDPGYVGAAVLAYRSVYLRLIADRRAA